MARTYRDKERIKRQQYFDKYIDEYIASSKGIQGITILQKLKRSKNNESNWPTPSWWVNLTMTRRRRREVRLFEHNVLLCNDLEICDPPMNWKRPHNYYW